MRLCGAGWEGEPGGEAQTGDMIHAAIYFFPRFPTTD